MRSSEVPTAANATTGRLAILEQAVPVLLLLLATAFSWSDHRVPEELHYLGLKSGGPEEQAGALPRAPQINTSLGVLHELV